MCGSRKNRFFKGWPFLFFTFLALSTRPLRFTGHTCRNLEASYTRHDSTGPYACTFQGVKNEKLLTDEARRRTRTMAIGHESDSGDLIGIRYVALSMYDKISFIEFESIS